MSNPIKEAMKKNEWAFYVKDLINTTNFYFYDLLVSEVLGKLRSATLSEIRESIFQVYKNKKIKLSKQQQATITRRISEILQLGIKENDVIKINDRYSFTHDLDQDGWATTSKWFPKKAHKLIWYDVYFSKLTPEQKEEISFPLHYKLIEKYARTKMLYEISKTLYGLKDKKTHYNQFKHKYEEQSLQLYLTLIKKEGFLQEFYNHLEKLERDDTKSNTEIDNLTLNLYTKYTNNEQSNPQHTKMQYEPDLNLIINKKTISDFIIELLMQKPSNIHELALGIRKTEAETSKLLSALIKKNLVVKNKLNYELSSQVQKLFDEIVEKTDNLRKISN